MVCVCVLRGSHNIQTISKPALGTQFGKCVYKCLFAVVGFHETDNSMKQYFNKWLRSLVFFTRGAIYRKYVCVCFVLYGKTQPFGAGVKLLFVTCGKRQFPF